MDCEEWLYERLSDMDYHLCENIRNEAKKKGYTMRELKAARKKLGIRTFHQFDELGATPNWYWDRED